MRNSRRRWLNGWLGKGIQAEHVADRGMHAAPDSAIWDLAVEIGAAIITKDEDFARRRTMNEAGPAVIWIRLPNTRRRALLDHIAGVWPDVIGALDRGETLIKIV